jgi:hypothetical protein
MSTTEQATAPVDADGYPETITVVELAVALGDLHYTALSDPHLGCLERAEALVAYAMGRRELREEAAEAEARAEAAEVKLAEVEGHLPAVLDALRIAVASGGYECERERYRAALVALGGSEEGEPWLTTAP